MGARSLLSSSRGHPFLRPGFRFGNLSWRHPYGDRLARFCGTFLTIGHRKVVPHVGFNKALRHGAPSLIHHSQLRKSQCISLLCGLLKPEQRHVVAVRCASPKRIKSSKVDLCACVPLVSGFFKPILCLKIVLWKLSSFAIQQPQFILSVRISGLSSFQNFAYDWSRNERLWQTRIGSDAT